MDHEQKDKVLEQLMRGFSKEDLAVMVIGRDEELEVLRSEESGMKDFLAVKNGGVSKGGYDMGIKLGTKVKDPITGFEGTAMARTVYLHGCARVAVQGPLDKDGKVPGWVHFDELQLLSLPSDESKGGPRQDPVSRPDVD